MLDRILLILKIKNLSSSKFAEEIGVQRSGISHILSGRNKPSLEFVQKLLNRFPEINTEWLISGTGEMLKSETRSNEMEFQSEINYRNDTKASFDLKKNDYNEQKNIEDLETINEKESFDSKESEEKTEEQNLEISDKNLEETSNNTEIERIMIFYKDKTFVEYMPGINNQN